MATKEQKNRAQKNWEKKEKWKREAAAAETFQVTPLLRWYQHQFDETTEPELQQAWEGSNGTIKWESIPNADEE